MSTLWGDIICTLWGHYNYIGGISCVYQRMFSALEGYHNLSGEIH